MDQEREMPVPDAGQSPTCANCGVPIADAGRRTPLCSACREQFIRFPFPAWVRIFGAAVLLLLVLALSTLPHTLGVGIRYKRGEAAEEKHNYVTAQRELEIVVKKEPSFVNAQCRLLLAAFYNNDLRTMAEVFQKLEGQKVENDDLYKEVNDVIREANDYYPGDSLSKFVGRYTVPVAEIPVADFYAYLKSNPADRYAKLGLADRMYDLHEYAKCDSLLNATLEGDPDYRPALSLKMPLKRELGQQDSSIYYADRLLVVNREFTYAYASKAKALLKQHKDKEALECARKGYAVDEKDNYMLGTLALAYHFNRDLHERDALLAKVSHDSTGMVMLAGIKDILSGKDKFRD